MAFPLSKHFFVETGGVFARAAGVDQVAIDSR
jgi:hypothetical protein